MSVISASFSAFRRQSWAEFFGTCIGGMREEQGRSIEQAAAQAQMTPEEWAALEAGQVPQDPEQMRRVAGALGMTMSELAPLILLCQEAFYK